MEDVKIVIIGAGIAGISAAERLIKHGFTNVKILEGEDRIGGRIYTKKYGDASIEMGAQWIHGEDCNPVFELARKNDLVDLVALGEPDRKELTFYMSNGQLVNSSVIRETSMILDNIFNEATKFSRENIPVESGHETVGMFVQDAFYRQLKTSRDSDDVKQMKDGLLNWRLTMEKTENACASMYDMSLLAWGEYILCSGQEAVELGQGGYQPILDLILNGIPESCFHLNTRVKEIVWGEDVEGELEECRSQVVTTSGEVFPADHVIVTCSLGYLKAHAQELFQPALPEGKMAAIRRLGFGTVNKIYLEFDEPFWDETCGGIQFAWLPEEKLSLKSLENLDDQGNSLPLSNTADRGTASEWYKGIHGFDVVARHTNLLCGWIAGVEAQLMEDLSDELVLSVCHELLCIFTGRDDIVRPSKIIRTSWHSNECTLGSYSYRHKGSNVGDSLKLAQPVPSDNQPWIQFAGEATHQTYFSTTHGAMLSGQREGERILSYYKGQSSLLSTDS